MPIPSIGIMEIDRPPDCRYMTVSECLVANGDRHHRNAENYRAADNEAFAAGSDRKAARNYARAALLRPWGI